MDFNKTKDKILYNRASWLIPLHPLIVWGDTTNDLESFYKRPEINLTDDVQDLVKKNDMRHIVGSARLGKTYNDFFGANILNTKEISDKARDILKYGKVSEATKKDTIKDWQNNNIGFNYSAKYPNASNEEIMQYAWGITNQAKPLPNNINSKLYEFLTNAIKEIN